MEAIARAVLLLALVAGLTFVLASLAPPRVEVARSTTIRAHPTTDARITATARRGDKLEVVDHTGNWYRVRTKSGDHGWIYGSPIDERLAFWHYGITRSR